MTKEEIRDLLSYFKLCIYRDGDYLLSEEYEELQEILKRSSRAKILEDARYKWIMGKISEEEYEKIYDTYDKELRIALKLKI